MALFPHRLPDFIENIFPSFIWSLDGSQKEIYLTFDDGPHPEITPLVMDHLEAVGFKGTFFCVGDNVKKYPHVYQSVIDRGHRVGNHTHHHLNGWKTRNTDYINNVRLCSEVVDSDLFRPPFGHIKKGQARSIVMDYKIVMWNIITGDFADKLNPAQALRKLKKVTQAGDIVVFHDSQKAWNNLKQILPSYLEYLCKLEFKGKCL